MADKKAIVGTGNYSWYFKHHYKNAGLIKIIEGCQSDHIKGVIGVTENTLLLHFPELKEKELRLKQRIKDLKLTHINTNWI